MSELSPLGKIFHSHVRVKGFSKAERRTQDGLTVLSPQNDPYRADTDRQGAEFFAAVFNEFRPPHVRGAHYVVVSVGLNKPDGTPYQNTKGDYEWLGRTASAYEQSRLRQGARRSPSARHYRTRHRTAGQANHAGRYPAEHPRAQSRDRRQQTDHASGTRRQKMTTELSPARLRLREALDAKGAEVVATQKAQAAVNRLEKIKAAVAPIEDELRQFDAAQAAEYSRYAGGDGEAPVLDVEKRRDLTMRFEGARAAAAGAQSASSKPTADMEVANRKIADIGLWSQLAVAQILIEEAEAMVPEMVEAFTAADRIKTKVLAGITEARSIADAVRNKPEGKNLPSDVHRDAELLDKKLYRLELPEAEHNPRGMWNEFAQRLHGDYRANLETA